MGTVRAGVREQQAGQTSAPRSCASQAGRGPKSLLREGPIVVREALTVGSGSYFHNFKNT